MFINSQQVYNSNGLYAHKPYNSNKFKASISENKGGLLCAGYEHEEFLDENMEAVLSEPPFIRRMKMFSRHDGFMSYDDMGVDFFSTSELLNLTIEIRLQLIRARPNLYMIGDNPNVSLEIVDCSLYTRHFALTSFYQKKHLYMLSYRAKAACGQEAGKRSFFLEFCKKNKLLALRRFNKHFSPISSNIFCCQLFVAASGILGGKVPVVYDILTYQAHELYLTSSPVEKSIEFTIQTSRNSELSQ